jgi:tripeptidyl-peptidase-1
LANPIPDNKHLPICAAVGGCASGRRLGSNGSGTIEVANSLILSGFSSGGGFSWWFDRPRFQDAPVTHYLQTQASTLPPARLFRQSGRAIPDVSSVAGNLALITNGAAWLGGGTSAAAPTWGAVWALATAVSLKHSGQPLGPASPLLYNLAATTTCFHDITQGDNRCPFSVAWQGHSCDCESCDGFVASTGWDPVTGLGTPNVSCLLEAVRGLPLPRPSSK